MAGVSRKSSLISCLAHVVYGWGRLRMKYEVRQFNFRRLARGVCWKPLKSVVEHVENNYVETAIERKIKQLWESEPFDVVQRMVQIYLDKGTEIMNLGEINNATSDANRDPFSAFYFGFHPQVLPTSPRESSESINRNPGSTHALSYTSRTRRKQSYSLILAYFGPSFCGWQRQLNRTADKLVSVQERVEGALENYMAQGVVGSSQGLKLEKTDVDIRVAGRTDAGVHAIGQVARVRVPITWLQSDLFDALEKGSQIDGHAWRCLSFFPVSEKFHPTFGATSRSYVYMVDAPALSKILLSWEEESGEDLSIEVQPSNHSDHLASFVEKLDRMFQSIQGLELDYFGLSHGKLSTESTMCSLSHARARLLSCSDFFATSSISDDEKEMNHMNQAGPSNTLVLSIELTGNRFLRRMVRLLVGTALQLAISRNRDRLVEEFNLIISDRDRRLAGLAAPPQGLVFIGASFDQY